MNRSQRLSRIAQAGKLGAKAALILALLYLVVITGLFFDPNYLIFALLVFFVGLMIGVLPAPLLGYLSGLLIGALVEIWSDGSPLRALALGASVPAIVTLIVAMITFSQTKAGGDGDWLGLLLFGVPFIIYIVTGGWLGWSLQAPFNRAGAPKV